MHQKRKQDIKVQLPLNKKLMKRRYVNVFEVVVTGRASAIGTATGQAFLNNTFIYSPGFQLRLSIKGYLN